MKETIGRPMEILLVEDSLVDARLAIGALQSGHIKHRMTVIPDGEEALRFLHKEGKYAQAPRPDLILLDLHLPKVDGLAVLGEVRADESLRSIPVVILTGSDHSEDRQQCQTLAVDSYITKPVNLAKFLSVVRELKDHWRADMILP